MWRNFEKITVSMTQNNRHTQAIIPLPYRGALVPGKCLKKSVDKEKISIPEYLNINRQCFVVKMSGDSMKRSGIFHNDLLIVESSSTATNNCIVLATIDNIETVIRHFEQTNDLIILSSKSADIKPMIFDPSRIKIMGVLKAQMRSYA